MVELTARIALESMMRATEDDATPIIRRLARVQARAILDGKVASDTGAGLRPHERLQAAWDSVETLPAIIFSRQEATAILNALATPTDATDGATGGGEVKPTADHLRGYYEGRKDAADALARFAESISERAVERATTPGGDLLEQADTYRQALEEIAAAPDAYSESIFREPDWQKAHDLLAAGGMTLDAISASNMRFVAERLAAAAEAALKPAGDGGEA
jgi:hypothetical protein